VTVGRARLLTRALWLERLTISWNVAEAVIAITAGWLAGSVALVGFGLDSVIETVSAAALYRRLRSEQAGASTEEAETQERRALRIVGVTFLLLGAYIAFEAAITLWTREPPTTSPVGILLAAVSLVVTGAARSSRTRRRPSCARTCRSRFCWASA
jgi:divalent metal cation (Fe/Co/Zn/Cd) transporter